MTTEPTFYKSIFGTNPYSKLSEIQIGEDLSFQVFHRTIAGIGQIYPTASSPADMGIMVRIGSTLYGPDYFSHSSGTATDALGLVTAWTPVSFSSISGSGASGDPWRYTLVCDAGNSGLRVSVLVKYFDNDNFFWHNATYTNVGAGTITFDVFVGSDIYLSESDKGFPYFFSGIGTPGSPGGKDCPTAGYNVMHIPVTPADRYTARFFNEVWAEIGAGDLDNVVASNCIDDGAALEWQDRTLAPGQSLTIDSITNFGPAPYEMGMCAPADSLVLNTGWKQVSGEQIAPGSVDNEWIVTEDPDAETTEPRPAFSIPRNTAWAFPQPASQWISSYPKPNNDRNGLYSYEYRFCLAGVTGASLQMQIRADDRVFMIQLNGNFIGWVPAGSFLPSSEPVHVGTVEEGPFMAGENVLRVVLENTNAVASGLNITGSVHGQLAQEHNCCSDSTAGLMGTCWIDKNRNRVRDAGELPAVGALVALSNGALTTTDILGNYYFLNLPEGLYTVGAVGGWTLTQPGIRGSKYQRPLGRGEFVAGLDFGYDQYGKITLTVKPVEAFPNPGNPSTTISFTVLERGLVSVTVFDVAGRLIRTLASGQLEAGEHHWKWDGSDDAGRSVASGVYFVRVTAGIRTETAKVMLLK